MPHDVGSVEAFTLRSGRAMPALSLGTWKMRPEDTTDAVTRAIAAGYRAIDCAPVYGNEKEVGAAIAACVGGDAKTPLAGVPLTRDDLFITSKIMTHDLPPEAFEARVRETLDDLGIDALDLLLLQWPHPQLASIAEQWTELERLVDAGLTRHIGVSNFSVKKLATLMDGGEDVSGGEDVFVFGGTRIPPAVNQIECGAHFRNDALLQYCKSRGVQVMAYGCLGSGDQFSELGPMRRKRSGPAPLTHPIARRHDDGDPLDPGPAAAVLRWLIERGVACVAKATTEEHQLECLRACVAGVYPPEWIDGLKAFGSYEEQYRLQHGAFHTGPGKPWKTLEDLWDDDVSYMEGRDFETPAGFALRADPPKYARAALEPLPGPEMGTEEEEEEE